MKREEFTTTDYTDNTDKEEANGVMLYSHIRAIRVIRGKDYMFSKHG